LFELDPEGELKVFTIETGFQPVIGSTVMRLLLADARHGEEAADFG
jgi:hypothetical protein